MYIAVLCQCQAEISVVHLAPSGNAEKAFLPVLDGVAMGQPMEGPDSLNPFLKSATPL
jgi:hypothetical protein